MVVISQPMQSSPTLTCRTSTRISCPRMAEAKRLERKRFSCSVISFFWGVDKAVREASPPHSLSGRRLS